MKRPNRKPKNDKEKDRPGALTGKAHIVIVDDDPGLRDVFEIILVQAGYTVEIKENGGQLLKNEYATPNLFLIDKQLSGFNGP